MLHKPSHSTNLLKYQSEDFVLTEKCTKAVPSPPHFFLFLSNPWHLPSATCMTGICIGLYTYKSNLFTDDMVVYLKDPSHSTTPLFEEINQCGQFLVDLLINLKLNCTLFWSHLLIKKIFNRDLLSSGLKTIETLWYIYTFKINWLLKYNFRPLYKTKVKQNLNWLYMTGLKQPLHVEKIKL